MKVGINATSLNDRPSGAKQRFVGIYGELFRQLPDNDFVIFGPSDCSLDKWFTNQLNVPNLDYNEIIKLSEQLGAINNELEAAELRWLELSEKQQA